MTNKSHNRKNYLLKALRIQEIYLSHKYKNDVNTGLSNRYIFQCFINPIYPMTERSFYNFLDMRPKAELKQIELKENTNV